MEIFDIISWTYIALTLLACGMRKVAESRTPRYALPAAIPVRVTAITPQNVLQDISLTYSRCPGSINPFFEPPRPMNPGVRGKKMGEKLRQPEHGGEVALDRYFLITLNEKMSPRGVETHLDRLCRRLAVPGERGIVLRTTGRNTYLAMLDLDTLLRITMMKEVERIQYLTQEDDSVVA